jgi:hypothetical protein
MKDTVVTTTSLKYDSHALQYIWQVLKEQVLAAVQIYTRIIIYIYIKFTVPVCPSGCACLKFLIAPAKCKYNIISFQE